VVVGSTMPSASPHRAAVERVTAPARARATHGDRTLSAQHAPCFRTSRAASSAGLGRQAVAQPSFRPAARGKLLGRVSQAVGRFEAHRCAAIFIVFQLF
jgi:hypothetical protein